MVPTVFEVGEPKYKEGNYIKRRNVPLARDQAKDLRHDFLDPVSSVSCISISTGHIHRDVSHLLGHARVVRHFLPHFRVPQPRIW